MNNQKLVNQHYFRHDVKQAYEQSDEKYPDTAAWVDFFNTGIMKQTCFNSLVKNTYLTREEIHDLLVKFDLATVIDSDQEDQENQEKNRLFIPSLISNENEDKIKDKFDDFKKRKNCIGFYFSIQKHNRTSQLFSHFLSKLATTTDLYNEETPGIHFDLAFSAKIENPGPGWWPCRSSQVDW